MLHQGQKLKDFGRTKSNSMNDLALNGNVTQKLNVKDSAELKRLNILDHLEDEFYENVKQCDLERFYVTVGFADDVRIWTVKSTPKDSASSNKTWKRPLIFIHGLCGGSAIWAKTMDIVSQDRVCYYIDLPGFAKSSRVEFSNTEPSINITLIVDLLEQWRDSVGLNEPFDIFGYSFGGYISSCYCLRYSEKVENLILLEPWGIVTQNKGWDDHPEINKKLDAPVPLVKGLSLSLRILNPLTLMRAGGIAGKIAFSKLREDVYINFADFVQKDTFFDYIYYCNSAEPTGEKFYTSCQTDVYFSKLPIVPYAHKFSQKMKLYILSAGNSAEYFTSKEIKEQLVNVLGEDRVQHRIFPDKTHNLYSNNEFLAELKKFFEDLC